MAGTVRGPISLDATGYRASLAVERVLAGPGQPGEALPFGWEELARSRPPRFAEGSRIVVALSPLPSGSLWRQRFPEGGRVVAAEGNAFLRDPDPRTLERLEAWARLDAAARDGKPGAAALAALVAEASPPVASGALARLADLSGLEVRLSGEGAALLAGALASGSRPEALQREILALVALRRLAGLKAAVESHAAPGDPLEAAALETLGALTDGLPAERVLVLLGRPEPAIRAAAARGARGEALARVSALVVRDPAPQVRLAAAEVVVSQRGMAGFGAVSPALFDGDATVRAGAAQALARLGAPAVPGLAALLPGRGMPAAGPVLGALVLAGPEGQAAVREVAAGHEDPEVRAAAALALGRPPSEH